MFTKQPQGHSSKIQSTPSLMFNNKVWLCRTMDLRIYVFFTFEILGILVGSIVLLFLFIGTVLQVSSLCTTASQKVWVWEEWEECYYGEENITDKAEKPRKEDSILLTWSPLVLGQQLLVDFSLFLLLFQLGFLMDLLDGFGALVSSPRHPIVLKWRTMNPSRSKPFKASDWLKNDYEYNYATMKNIWKKNTRNSPNAGQWRPAAWTECVRRSFSPLLSSPSDWSTDPSVAERQNNVPWDKQA